MREESGLSSFGSNARGIRNSPPPSASDCSWGVLELRLLRYVLEGRIRSTMHPSVSSDNKTTGTGGGAHHRWGIDVG